MKATDQYFPVILFIMLYKVVLTFESVDEILKCDHSNESYWSVLSCDTVYYTVQDGDCLNESYLAALPWGTVNYTVQGASSRSLIMNVWIKKNQSVGEILKCDHSNDSY